MDSEERQDSKKAQTNAQKTTLYWSKHHYPIFLTHDAKYTYRTANCADREITQPTVGTTNLHSQTHPHQRYGKIQSVTTSYWSQPIQLSPLPNITILDKQPRPQPPKRHTMLCTLRNFTATRTDIIIKHKQPQSALTALEKGR